MIYFIGYILSVILAYSAVHVFHMDTVRGRNTSATFMDVIVIIIPVINIIVIVMFLAFIINEKCDYSNWNKFFLIKRDK